jgi:DHA1 family bicyclomycin/chloramphenicol resistance-like MFS transporter
VLRAGTFALTALLAALTAIGPLSVDMYLPSLPSIAHLLDASPGEVQLTISAYLVGFAAGQVIYGPLSDRHGRKPVLLGALALYGAATLLCAVSPSITVLIIARALQALGGCGGIVLSRAIVRDLYSGARAGRELSLISSVMGLAPVIAPLAGGVLETAFGWRSNFVVLLLTAILLVLLVVRLLPETLRQRATEPVSAGSIVRAYHRFLGDRGYLAHLGLAVLCYAGLFAWISGAPFVLQNLYGLSPLVFGIAFAGGSVGYAFGAALATRLLSRFGIGGVIGIGSAALASGGLLMLVAPALNSYSAPALVIPAAIYLGGMGLVLPQAIAGALQPFPDRAGAASSLLGLVQQTVAAVCGIAVGQALGQSAWPVAGSMAFCGCASLVLWLLTRSVRAKAEHINVRTGG